MMLPDEIPPALKRLCILLPQFHDGLIAWLARDAIRVLRALETTKIGVSAGEVYRLRELCPTPVDDWLCDRLRSELAQDYARRSRAYAATQIQKHSRQEPEAMVFVIHFWEYNAAA